jgi:signal peptidase I
MHIDNKRRLLLIVSIFMVFAGAYAYAHVNSGRYRMPNSAMEPTINTGDTFLADMSAYESANPDRWDLVVFRSPKKEDTNWVFRVVGLPGETISFDDHGLLVDGETIDLPSRIGNVIYSSAVDGEKSFVVQNHSYFVLGDNPTKANDSRFWGTLSREAILGRVNEDTLD